MTPYESNAPVDMLSSLKGAKILPKLPFGITGSTSWLTLNPLLVLAESVLS
jgi:hypothetical protein